MNLSVIIPAYNEGVHIAKNIKRVLRILDDANTEYEIIVVDDGSTDNTRTEAEKIKHKRFKIMGYRKNRGKGSALVYGTNASHGRLITFFDSDLEIDPSQIISLVRQIESGADVVISSKNHPWSVINFPFYRKFLSKGYYFLTKLLFRLPLGDTQTGCKVFKRTPLMNALKKIHTKKFVFDLELLYYINKMGYKIAEYPVKINFKKKETHLNFKNVISMLKDTVTFFFITILNE